MIKKLQHRFIMVTMAGIGLIFIFVLLALNVSVDYSARQQGYIQLFQYEQQMLSDKEYPVIFPPQPDSAPDFEKSEPSDIKSFAENKNSLSGKPQPGLHWFNHMRISYIIYDSLGNIKDISTGENPEMTENLLTNMASEILSKNKEKGSISGYLYLCRLHNDNTYLFFMDYSPEKDMSMRLFEICLFAGLFGILVLFVLVIILSKWVSRPVQVAFDKQRQFIADASHELKTPLTIISTNAEVLENSLPDNKWLSHIMDQSARMNILINNLLDLAKLDAYADKCDFFPFDLSRAVKNAALSFESLAYEYGKNYTMEIAENLSLNGNDAAIRQLTTILLDNAFKYSDEKGSILIRLSCNDNKKVLLVHNSGNGIPASEQKHIFERFYRIDSSRNRKFGGYGLGLAIAKSIVNIHKGQILVRSDGQSYTEFEITLP